jgi:hypothetical protein
MEKSAAKISTEESKESVSTHSALIGFYYDAHCLEKLQLIVKVVIPDLSIDLLCNLDIDPEFVDPNRLRSIFESHADSVEICEQVKDSMFMDVQSSHNGLEQIGLKIDQNARKMSELIADEKQ